MSPYLISQRCFSELNAIMTDCDLYVKYRIKIEIIRFEYIFTTMAKLPCDF